MTFSTGGFTTSSGTNVIFTWTDTPPGEDDGFAGVREPRNPVIPPDCLIARRQPDGTWTVPAAIGR